MAEDTGGGIVNVIMLGIKKILKIKKFLGLIVRACIAKFLDQWVS